VLAQLYASGFLPEVWIADETTQALRRQVTRRNQIVRQRSRLKNIIQSILHAHLIPSCPHQAIDELQTDLDAWITEYNEHRPHQGRWCFGKTPMQTFLDALPLAKEKLMAA